VVTSIKGMREGMKPVMWAVAAAFVASLFFVGATTLRKLIRGEGHGPTIVEVGGKKIGQEDFERVFHREMRLRYQKHQRESSAPWTEDEERETRIVAAGAALNQIVQKELILAEAKRVGLRVTDEEVRSFVERNPNFQSGGEFNREVYERFLLEQTGMTPGEFEAELRYYLVMERLFAMVGAGARVSGEEAKALFGRENETARAAYAFLPATPDPAARPSEDALKAYYSAHLERYHAGERVAVRYALLDLAELRKKNKISDAEVREYYERNKMVHFDAGEVHVRHILFMVKPGEPEAAWEVARKKAEETAARVRAGADFAALAHELSDDTASAARGGDLGFFGRGQMDPEFEAAAFALKEGEVSGPVKTVYGYHVIKREVDVPSLEEQAGEIKETLEARAAEDQAMSLAMDLAARVGDGGDLGAEAATMGLKVETTEPFEANGPVGELGYQPRLGEEAFTLHTGDVGSALPVTEFGATGGGYRLRGYVVYQVTARLEPGPAPFQAVKDAVAKDWARDRALDSVAEAAAALYAGAKEDGNLDRAAKAAGASYGETAAFTRDNPAPALGRDYGVAAAAFGAAAGEVVGPLRAPSGYYVLKVLEKKAADPALYATRGEEYRQRLVNERQQLILAEWYRDLLARARVKNNLSAYLGAQEKGTAEREGGLNMPFNALGY
jgi:peptidyl-prolyl cis-trans isomerase D